MRWAYIREIWDFGSTMEIEEKHTGRYGARGQEREEKKKATPEEIAKQNQEINYKCLSDTEKKEGYYFKFNEKAILRTDSKTQKEVITGYVQNGIYTINEGRDLLDLPFVDGGDVNMVNGTYQPITHIGVAYGINTQGGEGDGD